MFMSTRILNYELDSIVFPLLFITLFVFIRYCSWLGTSLLSLSTLNYTYHIVPIFFPFLMDKFPTMKYRPTYSFRFIEVQRILVHHASFLKLKWSLSQLILISVLFNTTFNN